MQVQKCMRRRQQDSANKLNLATISCVGTDWENYEDQGRTAQALQSVKKACSSQNSYRQANDAKQNLSVRRETEERANVEVPTDG